MAKDEKKAAYQEANRAGHYGGADEPDAPTAEEEHKGMSTVLSAKPVIGVQNNAGEEWVVLKRLTWFRAGQLTLILQSLFRAPGACVEAFRDTRY